MAKKSDAVKIAEVQAQKEVLLGFAQNPMVALVAGVIILELAERAEITGPIITTSTEVGLVTVCVAQALAPLVPALLESTATAGKALALIPGM